MVTINEYGNQANKNTATIYGKSTDEKPIGIFEGYVIPNGSWFIEQDTGKLYTYDEENKAWIEFTLPGIDIDPKEIMSAISNANDAASSAIAAVQSVNEAVNSASSAADNANLAAQTAVQAAEKAAVDVEAIANQLNGITICPISQKVYDALDEAVKGRANILFIITGDES